MNRKGYFSWRSSLMEIISAEERVSKSTEKPYMVVKARMVFFGNMKFSPLKKQASKNYTMVCFKESLFGLFEAGNQHIFEGELSFDWGNTWMKIMKLYDDCGKRLLRLAKSEKTNAFDEKTAESASKSTEEYFTARIKETQEENEDLACKGVCEECLDYDTSDCPIY